MSNQNQSVVYKSQFKSYSEDRKLIYCCDCIADMATSEDELFTFDADDFDRLMNYDSNAKCDMCNQKFSLCSYCDTNLKAIISLSRSQKKKAPMLKWNI